MKTAKEILQRHTNSEDWTSGFENDVLDAMNEYAQQFASQSSDKEEREPDGWVIQIKVDCSSRTHFYYNYDSIPLMLRKDSTPVYFSPPKESEGKELSDEDDNIRI